MVFVQNHLVNHVYEEDIIKQRVCDHFINFPAPLLMSFYVSRDKQTSSWWASSI